MTAQEHVTRIAAGADSGWKCSWTGGGWKAVRDSCAGRGKRRRDDAIGGREYRHFYRVEAMVAFGEIVIIERARWGSGSRTSIQRTRQARMMDLVQPFAAIVLVMTLLGRSAAGAEAVRCCGAADARLATPHGPAGDCTEPGGYRESFAGSASCFASGANGRPVCADRDGSLVVPIAGCGVCARRMRGEVLKRLITGLALAALCAATPVACSHARRQCAEHADADSAADERR